MRRARAPWAVLLLLGCAPSEGTEREREGAPPPASVSTPSQSGCGGPEQACCTDTGFACSRGSSCDPDAGVCRASAPSASTACRTDEHCAPDRRCCQAGMYGTCQALEPEESCPLPDLAVMAAGRGINMLTDPFDGVTPSAGGCVRERGMRQRLMARVAVANFGVADFILGERDTLTTGSGSPHDDFLRYTLLDASGGAVASSRGPLPCVEGDATARYTCGFGGIAAGSVVPALGQECEGLDVTGLPAGQYRLRVELTREWPDVDPSNGRIELPVDLPSFDPLEPCPAIVSSFYEGGAYRECGWAQAPLPAPGTCAPGEAIALDCGGCVNYPVLRLCPGDGACTARSALATASGYSVGSDGNVSDPCTGVYGTCTASGRYNVLIGSEDPTLESTCTLSPSPNFF